MQIKSIIPKKNRTQIIYILIIKLTIYMMQIKMMKTSLIKICIRFQNLINNKKLKNKPNKNQF